MRNIIRKMITAVTLLGIIVGSAGCSNNEEIVEKTNTAFLIGNTNHNPVFDCSIDEFASLSGKSGSSYTMISCDGEPNLIYEGTVPDFRDRGYTKTMLERVRKDMQEDIKKNVMGAVPDDPETNFASGLDLGVRAIRAKEIKEFSNSIVIAHNGISTAGKINMLDVPIAKMDVEKSVEVLVKTLNIDLNSIDVIWYFLGDTRGGQSALSSEEEQKLEEFYTSLLTGLGAKSVTFKKSLALTESYDFPEQQVSCMPVNGDESCLVDVVSAEEVATAEEATAIFQNGKGMIFDEKAIGFQPGTVEFLDEQAAGEAISYVVEFMRTNQDFEMLICAGCAGDVGIDVENSYVLPLSQDRADAVKRILCEELGVDGKMIFTKGLGSSGPFHIEGLGLGAEASVNRNVIFLPADSEQAQEILNVQDGESQV